MIKAIATRILTTAAALGLLCGACGNTKSGTTPDGGGSGGSGGSGGAGGGGGPINVAVSGIAAPHPLTRMAEPSADFSMLTISVIDPLVEIMGGAPLATADLDTSPANCGLGSAGDGGAADSGAGDAGAGDAAAGGDGGGGGASSGCVWSFPTVNIGGISLGLVGKIEDRRTGTRLWIRTGTGMGTAGFINGIKSSRAPITGRQAFAVTHNTIDWIAGTIGTAIGNTALSGAQVEAQGLMIGHVIGRLSAGAQPVAGATVTPTAADKVDVVYPDATFTSTGAATAAHGMFLVLAKAATPQTAVVTSWRVNPPAGDARTWEMHTAGTDPNGVFVILMPADE